MATPSPLGQPLLQPAPGQGGAAPRGRVVAWLSAQRAAGKTTLAMHLAGELAMQGRRVSVLDADPRGSALDWAQRRTQRALPRLHGVYGLARESLDLEACWMARDFDWVVIDGPPSAAPLTRAAMRAADLVLIALPPGAGDALATRRIVRQLVQVRVSQPNLRAAFVLNRCTVGAPIGRAVRAALADLPLLPTLRAAVRERAAFAQSLASGQLACEASPLGAAACEMAALAQAVREALA